MFDTAVACDVVLVSTGVEETQVKGFFVFWLINRKVDLAFVNFAIVVVRVITTKAPDVYPSVIMLPFIDGKQDEALADAPGIG